MSLGDLSLLSFFKINVSSVFPDHLKVVALQFVDVAPPLVAPQRVVDALLHRVAIARAPIVSVPLPHVAFSQWLPVVVVQILAALRLPLYSVLPVVEVTVSALIDR